MKKKKKKQFRQIVGKYQIIEIGILKFFVKKNPVKLKVISNSQNRNLEKNSLIELKSQISEIRIKKTFCQKKKKEKKRKNRQIEVPVNSHGLFGIFG